MFPEAVVRSKAMAKNAQEFGEFTEKFFWTAAVGLV